MKYLMWILLVFVFVLPLIRYALFAVSNFRELRRGSKIRLSAFVRGYATSVVSDVLVIFSGLARLFLRSVRDSDGVPIILVHGLYHNPSAWVLFQRRLEHAGFGNVRTYYYNSFTGSYEAATDGLAAVLEEVFREQPDSRPVLIGHSLGGMVIRGVAGRDAYRERLGAVVTLGTPYGGSELAWLGVGPMARGLIPGKAICEQAAGIADPECPRIAVTTPVDDYVFPNSCLEPKREGWLRFETSPMSHVYLLFSRQVFQFVRRVLETQRKA